MEVSGVGREFSEGTNNGTSKGLESKVREELLAEKRFEVQEFFEVKGSERVKEKARLLVERLRAQGKL